MIIYSLIFLSGLCFGIFLYWLFDKKIKITISPRENNNLNKISFSPMKQIKESSKEENKLNSSDRLYKATCLINEIKLKGKLPCELSPAVLHSLTIIAKTPEWEKQLDDESIKNLNRIYDKWQRHVKASRVNTVQHVGAAGNMEEPKYWEGTEEEYFNALEEGIIDEKNSITEWINNISSDAQRVIQKTYGDIKTNDNIIAYSGNDLAECVIQSQKELLENWKMFVDYEWLNQINKCDRLKFLKDIYDTYGLNDIPEFIYKKYSKYDKKLIKNIYLKEKNRLNIRVKAYFFAKKDNTNNEKWFSISMPVNNQDITGHAQYYDRNAINFEYLLYLNLTNDFDCYYSDGNLVLPDIIPISNKVNKFPISLLYNHTCILILNEDEFNYMKKQVGFSLELELNKELH